jgi:hypothetical protein
MSASPVIPSAASSAPRLSNGRPDLRRTPPMWGRQYDEPELEDDRDRKRLEMGMNAVAGQSASPRRRNARSTQRLSGAIPVARPAVRGPSPAGSNAGHSAPIEPIPEPVDAAPAAQPRKGQGAKTVNGFMPHGDASQPIPEPVDHRPAPIIAKAAKKAETFAQTASKTMPLGLNLDEDERAVLNALGQRDLLTAAEIGELIAAETDPMEWMSALMDKLGGCGLELVVPGEDKDGEPTYILAH